MSILNSLLRFVDPVGFRQQQEDRRRQREVLPPDVDGDDLDLPQPRVAAAGPARVCRLCRHPGDAEDRYCPHCLAETMERPR